MNYGSDGNLYQVAIADFNGDGKLDLVASDISNGWVQIFTGNGDGTFTTGSTYATDASNTRPDGIVVGDFNKDGLADLAVQNTNGQNVAILINNGQGGFNAPVTYALSTSLDQWRGQQMAVADLAGTGNLDLVIPLYDGQEVAVLMGNGDGTFQPETDLAMPSGYPNGVTLVDLNKDGKLDLAVTLSQWAGSGIAVALGNGDGTFQTPTLLAASLQDYNYDSPYPSYITNADIDGDGNVDLVYTNSEYGTVGVLFGLGNGSFYDPVEYPSGGYSWGITVADVNQDGAPDVVTAADDYAGVTVLLNSNGSGVLGNYTMSANASSFSVTAGQSATFTFTITPSNHYNGTITFACPTGLPALATCTFSPASVTMDGVHPVTVQLTISTTAPAASSKFRAAVDPQGVPHHKNSSPLLVSMSGMGVFGMMLTGSFGKKINRSALLGMLVLGILFLVGCGGSSKTPTSKTATTSTVSSSTATVLVGQSVTFTGTVSATSGTPTGMVTFLDGSTSLGTGTLSGGTATLQTSSLAAGVHNITATYSGDSNFDASTSAALAQTVDNPGTAAGSYTVHVTATGTTGTNGVKAPTQTMNVNLTVQ